MSEEDSASEEDESEEEEHAAPPRRCSGDRVGLCKCPQWPSVCLPHLVDGGAHHAGAASQRRSKEEEAAAAPQPTRRTASSTCTWTRKRARASGAASCAVGSSSSSPTATTPQRKQRAPWTGGAWVLSLAFRQGGRPISPPVERQAHTCPVVGLRPRRGSQTDAKSNTHSHTNTCWPCRRFVYKLKGPEACNFPVTPELAAELDALTVEQIREQFRQRYVDVRRAGVIVLAQPSHSHAIRMPELSAGLHRRNRASSRACTSTRPSRSGWPD